MTGSLKTVRIEKVYPASVERLYRAWLNPDDVRRWLAPGVMKVTEIAIDACEGGKYCVQMRDPAGAMAEVEAGIRVLVPEERIELQWQWKGLSRPARLIVEFIPVSDEETGLRLTHGEFDTMDETQNHQNGWEACLGKLEKVFAVG